MKRDPDKEFTHEEETLLQTIADRLAGVIDARWRQAAATRHLLQLEDDLAFQRAGAGSLSRICEILGEEFMRHVRANSAHFRILDRSRFKLHLEAGSGVLESVPKEILNTLPHETLPRFESDLGANRGWEPLGRWLSHKEEESAYFTVRSAGYIPLIWDQEKAIAGAVFLTFSRTTVFDSTLKGSIEDLASRAKTALQPLIRQRHLQLELERLREIGLRFAATPNLPELMEDVIETAKFETGMDIAHIRLLDDEGKVLNLVSQTSYSAAAVPRRLSVDEFFHGRWHQTDASR